MGQYFIAVNMSKKEFIHPHDIGGGLKLWEWCANSTAGIFPYLLRESSEGGGGDINIPHPEYAGHWAGDEVYLIGDYDESELYEKAQKEFSNISKPLAQEYNDFIEIDECKLQVKNR